MSTPYDILLLYGTAAWIGLIHTLLGPDHYLPFIAMSRAGDWTKKKTLVVTVVCGIGHVSGSIMIGAVGIAVGVALFQLDTLESWRGDVAGWIFLTFGAIYFVWGLRQAIRNKPHTHLHLHDDGTLHSHQHVHQDGHIHVHPNKSRQTHSSHGNSSDGSIASSMTPWVLFTLFIFGPCEALIPVLMYPAAKGQWWDIVFVTGIFGATTVTTMTTLVLLGTFATESMRLPSMERYGHALAGLVLLGCGAMMKVGL